MKKRLFYRFLALHCSAAATLLLSHAQIHLSPVAYNGMSAPGPGGEGKFQWMSFNGAAAINGAGQVIFTMDGKALWAGTPNALQLVGAAGSTAPGTSGAAQFSTLGVNAPGTLTAAGQVAFSALLSDSDSNFANDNGLWSGTLDNPRLVARGGERPPGTEFDVTFQAFSAEENPLMDALGHVAFYRLLTGPGVQFLQNDRGIWFGSPGELKLVARAGDPAPGLDLSQKLDVINPPSMNAAGELLFVSTLKGLGITARVNDSCLWFGRPGALRMLARAGDAAPGLEAGVKFGPIGSGSVNDSGKVAFNSLLAGSSIVSGKNHSALWLTDAGSFQLLARVGNPAAGTSDGVAFSTLGLPLLNAKGQAAFSASVGGLGVGPLNRDGIWVGSPGTLQLVARTGDAAPGTGDGVKFERFFNQALAVNSSGWVGFHAGLIGPGLDPSNNQGIWIGTPGSLQLVARLGQEIDFAGGSHVFQQLFPRGVSATGESRSTWLNDAGQLVFFATFTDGQAGVFLAQLSTGPTATPPRITSIDRVGNDMQVSFTSTVGRHYQVESKPGLSFGAWSPLPEVISGTGKVVTLTDTGVTGFAARFYRVRAF